MKDLDLKFGADPEVFVKLKRQKNFVSAHGLVSGTKDEPFKVDKGAVQVDGMALEFNIDPAENQKEFSQNIKTVMKILGEMVPDHKLVPSPTADFDPEYLASQPYEALELGCDPDFNAYDDGKPNPRPDGNVNFRTGAGHIHIGWCEGVDITNPDHLEACMTVVKQLDWSLGLLATKYDTDERRRSLYGNWGAFRPKPYGVEYRVLSNAWLKSPKLVKWVYNTAYKAIQDLYKGEHRYLDRAPEVKYIPYLTNVWGYKLPPEVK